MTNHENTHDTTNLTLVLGGAGKSGRREAERLEAHGVPVRISSRSTEPAVDWADESTWAAADVMLGVEEALGRRTRDFSEHARVTAATGVWSA